MVAFLAVVIMFTGLPITAMAKESKTVRVGFYICDGYQMIDEKGTRSGCGVDLLACLRRYVNHTYSFVDMNENWTVLFDKLYQGEYDMLTGVNKTPERQEKFDFSTPLWSYNTYLACKADSEKFITGNPESFQNVKTGVWRGVGNETYLQEYAKSKGISYTPVYFDTNSDIIAALEDGTIDATYVIDIHQLKNIRYVDIVYSEPCYIAVKKGNNELLDEINYAIAQMDSTQKDWRSNLLKRYTYENKGEGIILSDKEKALI